ncbi:MAG TPA: arginase [Roseomonas sp.]|jgi:arginase
MHCVILGAPVQDGAGRMGCEMGPSALRTAGLAAALSRLGRRVEDRGDVRRGPAAPLRRHPNPAIQALPAVAAWVAAIGEAGFAASAEGMPIVLGGDHSIAAGTIPAFARRARERGRPLFVLWLDAHPDFHTLESSESGHLHGVALAYVCGRPGFAGWLPDLPVAVDPSRVCTMGLRSVDVAERPALAAAGVTVHTMRAIAAHGIAPLLRGFLQRVAAADGVLHVSLDVDFLDPGIAPAVGTAVPGGASLREAQLAMAMLHESGRVGSLDLVELNPLLDEGGRTAALMVDLTAHLLGRPPTGRPTRSH